MEGMPGPTICCKQKKRFWILLRMILQRVLEKLHLKQVAYAKVYERCEFAREIQSYGVPADQVATWVCIAQHESNFDTAAVNWSSGDPRELYWCSTGDTPGGGCNARCSQFEDDDIRDDTVCAQLIYGQSGFQAWTTYQYCNGDVSSYIAGC
ncbi:hypothetical protein NQ317_010227 [Molorchus minor]|uniref:lysozyme n=1 Tax=Molorchus minor TaxID=1323400 RepID=A0ABQ9J3T3_9CUCU|nr:hypothetical protein NQ317_010227 [Molorchus minor]